MSKDRYLRPFIFSHALSRGKMAFVSGPRQVGKTTLAKEVIHSEGGLYRNWDQTEFRRNWTRSPNALLSEIVSFNNKTPVLVLDEIHKAPLWKRTLKGLYDTLEKPLSIIVTGSARLDIYKKGGDSLLGRYVGFRLHPFSLGEILKKADIESPDTFFDRVPKVSPKASDNLVFENLLEFGGFPEPFTEKNRETANIWVRSRIEKIVREDLRDLSKLTELGKVEMLVSLIPERVGQPLSLKSFGEDVEASYNTVKRWVNFLKQLFYLYEIKPYSKSIPATLKKEGKVFLWDWSELTEEGQKFENLVASHLLKACHFWTDIGKGNFELQFLKNKLGHEVDFLVCKNRKPWMSVECKLSDTNYAPQVEKFSKHTKHEYHFQIVRQPNVFKKMTDSNINSYICSADRFLAQLP